MQIAGRPSTPRQEKRLSQSRSPNLCAANNLRSFLAGMINGNLFSQNRRNINSPKIYIFTKYKNWKNSYLIPYRLKNENWNSVFRFLYGRRNGNFTEISSSVTLFPPETETEKNTELCGNTETEIPWKP